MPKAKTAATICFLEGPAWHCQWRSVFQRHHGQSDFEDGRRRRRVGVSRRQRPDQWQHVRRPGAADQLRGGRVRARRPAPDRAHRRDDRRSRGAHRPLRGQTLQRPQRRVRRHAAGASGSPIRITGPTAPAWKWAPKAVYCIDGSHGAARGVAAGRSAGPTAWRLRPTTRRCTSSTAIIAAGGNRKIWAFDVRGDGSLGGQRLVFDFGRGRGGDGMRLDRQGNLWIAAGVLKHAARE